MSSHIANVTPSARSFSKEAIRGVARANCLNQRNTWSVLHADTGKLTRSSPSLVIGCASDFRESTDNSKQANTASNNENIDVNIMLLLLRAETTTKRSRPTPSKAQSASCSV